MRNRTTSIDKLPFLQENEYFSGYGNVPQTHQSAYSKIRSKHTSPIESGMHESYTSLSDNDVYNYSELQDVDKGDIIESYKENISCIDVADHIKTCPICSRLYDQDRTIFYVVIALLVIVCLFLLKRVLNV